MNASFRHGFVRVGAAVPQLKVADPAYNMERIYEILQEADRKKISVLVFPELCLTGYTCGDLFDQRFLRSQALNALSCLLQKTAENQVLAVIGMPLELQDGLYNCAVVIQNGNILGVVPKMYLPDFGEYRESRWFLSGLDISRTHNTITLLGRNVPFGHLIFASPSFCLGIEICEDMWLPVSPGVILALQGANLIANPVAGNEGGGKSENRLKMVQRQSSRCQAAYILASAGTGESTTDLVFGGQTIIGENGNLLIDGEDSRFCRQNTLVYTEVDIESLTQIRLRNKSFSRQKGLSLHGETYMRIPVKERNDGPWQGTDFVRPVKQKPFEPSTLVALDNFCREILEIQKAALAKRLESTDCKHVIVELSENLNSVLALIAATETMALLNLPVNNACALYLPDKESLETKKQENNLRRLAACLGADFNSINIQKFCTEHDNITGKLLTRLEDCPYDRPVSDSPLADPETYAAHISKRIRYALLNNLAQQKNALLLGSANMSQNALGLATWGGDLSALYQINAGLPFTVVQQMVKWALKTLYKGEEAKALNALIKDIINSPLELEDQQGPYLVYDFFLYYTLKFGTEPAKLLFLARQAFGNTYDLPSLKKWIKTFYKRFFNCQAQRSAAADGPKVLGLSLSPRAGLHLPSDAQGDGWWNDLSLQEITGDLQAGS